MSDLEGYKSWLAQLQGQYTFKNNYWCAMLAKEMEEDLGSAGFKIPYFIMERELKKNSDTSVILRLWIEHLLKAFNEEVNATNSEAVLRDFLESNKILPTDVTSPLNDSISFHSLPAECKLWILYALRTYNKPSRELQKIAKDPLSNTYYIVPDCRLYVKIGKPVKCALPIDEEEIKEQPWESLYRFVHAEHWILLCENEDEWDKVWKKFLSFKMNNLYNSLKPDMMTKVCEHKAKKMHNHEEEQQKMFEEEMNKMNAASLNDPTNRSLNEHRPVASVQPVSKDRQSVENADVPKEGSLVRGASMSSLCSSRSLAKSVVRDADSEEYFSADSSSSRPADPKEITWCSFLRCCKYKTTTCKYKHPSEKCKKFPECPKGGVCRFLHEVCESRENCSRENCDYEHDLPHEIGNRWCKYGSRCNKFGCKFIHPKECFGICPAPNGCWMYHSPRPAFAAGPGRGISRGNMRGAGYPSRSGGFGPGQGGQPPVPSSRTPGRVSSPPSPTSSQSSEADR